jgi:hypothetical protein
MTTVIEVQGLTKQYASRMDRAKWLERPVLPVLPYAARHPGKSSSTGRSAMARTAPPRNIRDQGDHPRLADRLQPACQKILERSARRCRIGAGVFVARVRGRPRAAPPRTREPRS